MNIVLDTDVILSALISNRGYSYKLLNYIFMQFKEKNRKINSVSVPTILELETVLFREENRKNYPQFTDKELNSFIDFIVLMSHQTKLNYLWRPFLKDSGDDKILETALNSSSKYIITFNKKDFIKVEKKFDIQILNPKEFFEKFEIEIQK